MESRKKNWSGAKPLMSRSDLLRWIGNILLIIGYQTMLCGGF